MTRRRAILFDFDGTLSPTIENVARAWVAVLARHGITITTKDYFPLEGMNMKEIAAMFLERAHLPRADAQAIVQEKEHEQLSYARGFELYPGVGELLDRLALADVSTAIVTASSRMKLRQLVPEAFLNRFQALIAGEDVSEGKPSPVGYLLAAERIGIPAHAAIVVENAPLGVTAAKRAGMYCIALAHTVAAQELVDADEIFENFHELQHSPTVHTMLEAEAYVS